MLQNYLRRILLNRWAAFIHDLFWIPVSILLAFLFRFNLRGLPDPYLIGYWKLTAVAVPVYAYFFWYYGLYRGIWRFASIPDLVRIIKAVAFGLLTVPLVAFVILQVDHVPRTVLFLSPMLLIICLIGPRLGYRLLKDKRFQVHRQEGKRTLIVGAGQAGDLLLRDLLSRQDYQPVAFVDDDTRKHGRDIHGVRVYGKLSDINYLKKALHIDLVLFAIPSAPKELINKLIIDCASAGVEFKTLPSLHDKNDGRIEVAQLRALTIDDLLGRDQVTLDHNTLSAYLNRKVVLVTGSGGSIGSELCRQIAEKRPKKLIIFDNSEYNLYSIDNELRSNFPSLDLVTVLGDIKSRERVSWVFQKFQPNIVFHAAAYKHVPMLELNPAEAVFNNIIGTTVIARAADQYHSECFVMISTDKAVNPANIMGCTKRVAEIFCQNIDARSQTRYITTRFGNVLGSTGSVVPLFEKQIKAGGPVTVTHPEITRYFMTIPEAVSLILLAGAMGSGGQIYVLNMGKPVLIKDLAEKMIRLSGSEPGRDIKIVFTGLRPGEKLYEEIFHEGEKLRGTAHTDLLLARSRSVEWNWLENEITKLEEASQSRDVKKIISHLRSIVPEFHGGQVAERMTKKVTLRVVGQ